MSASGGAVDKLGARAQYESEGHDADVPRPGPPRRPRHRRRGGEGGEAVTRGRRERPRGTEPASADEVRRARGRPTGTPRPAVKAAAARIARLQPCEREHPEHEGGAGAQPHGGRGGERRRLGAGTRAGETRHTAVSGGRLAVPITARARAARPSIGVHPRRSP